MAYYLYIKNMNFLVYDPFLDPNCGATYNVIYGGEGAYNVYKKY